MYKRIECGNRSILSIDDTALLSTKVENILEIKEPSIKKIANYFAEGDSEIEGVILGDNIEEIGEFAFSNSPHLKFVVLGKNTKKIQPMAFIGDNQLTSLYYNGSQEEYLRALNHQPIYEASYIICNDGKFPIINYELWLDRSAPITPDVEHGIRGRDRKMFDSLRLEWLEFEDLFFDFQFDLCLSKDAYQRNDPESSLSWDESHQRQLAIFHLIYPEAKGKESIKKSLKESFSRFKSKEDFFNSIQKNEFKEDELQFIEAVIDK